MASIPKFSFARLVADPWRGAPLAFIALTVWIAGAGYCMGYEQLRSGSGNWPNSLLWSAYGVMPWLVLFEAVKRRDLRRTRPLGLAALLGLLLLTGAISLLLEGIAQPNGSPLALQVMRRLPALAATMLLLLLARREQRLAARQAAAATESEVETLRRHASSIHFIRAADNYLELHLDGQVWTRRITMREAEAILGPLGFVRVHRSVIVNRDHVERIVAQKGGPAVQTRDGTMLPTGKAYSANLRQLP